MEQLQCVVETSLAIFYAFLIFDPKWRFCKVYSLCLVAIFGHFQNALIFPILALFWSRFCREQLQCVVETYLACFYAILIFDPKWRFCKVYSLCLVAIFGNFQNALIFPLLDVFGAVSCIEQLQCVVETFLACFCAFLIFDPKWRFCKVYSLCLVAIFGNFQNALIFPILAVFWSRFFWTEQLQCVVETFLACFYAFLIFDPKWQFCKVYSLCLVAIFGHFQNALIFPILALFWSRFCIEQLQCVVETYLACFYAILIFDPKWRFCKVYSLCLVAIFGNFQNALIFPLLDVFGAVSCIEQLQCVVETFLACFCAFLIFDPKWRFCKVYSLCLVAIFGNFQNALIFPILAVFWSRFFWTEQLQCVVETFLACFYAFLIFDPKWEFCKVYSLCLVAIFGDF